MTFTQRSADWSTISQVGRVADMSNTHWHWFCHPGSLTARFNTQFQGQMQFQLLQAGWKNSLPEETELLRSDHQAKYWVREINWRYEKDCWVVARVVIPPLEIDSPLQSLLQIGAASIGEVLFAAEDILKQPFEIAKITPSHPYFSLAKPWLNKTVDFVWARRRLFSHKNDKLLVSELFLPSFFEFDFDYVD